MQKYVQNSIIAVKLTKEFKKKTRFIDIGQNLQKVPGTSQKVLITL